MANNEITLADLVGPEDKGPKFEVRTGTGGELVLTGQLRYGLRLGGSELKEFEMVESTMPDIFAAEEVADPSRPITFAAALICRQLRRVGDYDGPFSMAFLSKLKKTDFNILRLAQLELEKQGEG